MITDAKIYRLREALAGQGVRCEMYQDRSPICVRIPLTNSEDEFSPGLYVTLEDDDHYRFESFGKQGWYWEGVIMYVEDLDLNDVTLRFIERSWVEDETDVALQIAALLTILRGSSQLETN